MSARSPSTIESTHGPVLRWPTSRSRDWTTGFLQLAANDPNVIAVVAVGSAVRPQVASADLDLVVICVDPVILDRAHPLEVDLRAYASATVDAELKRGNDILGWAVMFGQVLYQGGGYWDRIITSWRDRLPLPSSKLARKRAIAAYRYLVDMVELDDLDAAQEQALSYLTHLARAELLERGIYPASRPELPSQLRTAGNLRLAQWLHRLQQGEITRVSQINELTKLPIHSTSS